MSLAPDNRNGQLSGIMLCYVTEINIIGQEIMV